jgi:hypothetical protein
MDTLFPTKSIAVLVCIGFLDLISTAILHANGLIVEMNPLMRYFIERSEIAFAMIKCATIVSAWYVLAVYARINLEFVNRAGLAASCLYGAVWLGWFTYGMVR